MKKQKLFAMVCVAVLAFSTVGCGDSDSPDKEKNEQAAESSSGQTEEKADG